MTLQPTPEASKCDDRPAGNETLRMERTFNATPERVFDAWITPKFLSSWFGPRNMRAECSIDALAGGTYRCTMVSASGDRFVVEGEVRVLERPHRLVMSWAWLDGDGARGRESEVEVNLSEHGDGTLMRFEHRGLVDRTQDHFRGWTTSLERLSELFCPDNAGAPGSDD